MTPSSPQQALPQIPSLPNAIPPPPVIQAQAGQKPSQGSLTPSFLGSSSVPSKMNLGQKSLIGK